MFNVWLAGENLYGKWLLDEILDWIESVPEKVSTYS